MLLAQLLVITLWLPAKAVGYTHVDSGHQFPQLLAFQSVGKMVHTRGYAHLHFQIDLERPIAQLEAFITQMGNAREDATYNYGEGSNYHKPIHINAELVQELRGRLRDLARLDDPIANFLLPAHTDHLRLAKRQLGLLMGGIGVFMGFYAESQVAELRDQMNLQRDTQSAIIHQVDIMGQRLNQQAAHMYMLDEMAGQLFNKTTFLGLALAHESTTNALVSMAIKHVRDLEIAVEAAMDHRASIVLAPLTTVAESLANVSAVARNMG
jgi:hypothetical protein